MKYRTDLALEAMELYGRENSKAPDKNTEIGEGDLPAGRLPSIPGTECIQKKIRKRYYGNNDPDFRCRRRKSA